MRISLLVAGGGLALAGTLCLGILIGRNDPAPLPKFHDIRVNHVGDYTRLVEADHPAVTAMAEKLGNPEAAYYFVRDIIRFEPQRPAAAASRTLGDGAASCIGKAILLCSLYRAMGIPAENVRVVTGEVVSPEGNVDHAWVDMEFKGQCLQLDPTQLLGSFPFRAFPGASFSRAFIGREHFCFNDAGFAVVSQLNRFRDSPAPGLPPYR